MESYKIGHKEETFIIIEDFLKVLQYLKKYEFSSSSDSVILDKQWFDFEYEHQKEKFHSILKLCREGALEIKYHSINLEYYNQIDIEGIQYYKNTELLSILEKYNFDYHLMDIHWNEISKIIKNGNAFGISLKINSYGFFRSFFNTITKQYGYKNIQKKEVKSLFDVYIGKKNERENVKDNIIISYNLIEYIDNKRITYPLLYELEVAGKIFIKEVRFESKGGYQFISFHIESIIEDNLENFINAYDKVISGYKIEFYEDDLYINGTIINFRNKDDNHTYKYIKFLFEYFYEYKVNNVAFTNLENFYNEIYYKKYKCINKWNIFNKGIKRLLEKKNENIYKQIGLNDLFGISNNGIECQYLII